MASAMTAMGIGALAMAMRDCTWWAMGGVAEPLWEQAIGSKSSTGLACRAYFVGVFGTGDVVQVVRHASMPRIFCWVFGNTSKHQRAFCVSDGII